MSGRRRSVPTPLIRDHGSTSLTLRGRILFAPSRYGPDIIGGAEAVQRELAVGLSKRGWDVEVYTSCAVDHFRWENVLPEGTAEIDGILVHRFPAEAPVPERAIHEANILAGARMPISDQYRWLNAGMRSPGLYHQLLRTYESFRGVVFTPYPTWLAVAGSQLASDRSVLWTCLHDEPTAWLEIFQPMFMGAAGLLLQSDPEQDLLHEVVARAAPHEVVGCTVPVAERYDPEGFRRRFDVDGPFVLYAGRREGAKGWDELLAMFAASASAYPELRLVTFGSGAVVPPLGMEDRVVDLGVLSDDDRNDAFAAATAYLQPSRYEAFSRTIMEAWLAGTPVIGNAASAVVAWHCERSGAGLLYRDAYELEQCLATLAGDPELGDRLAEGGRAYVLQHYQPDAVIDRIEAKLDEWLPVPGELA